MTDTLEPLPEDWERGLVIVAHPDDMEYGGGAAIARWTSQGKQIAYCLVTSGEAGIDGMPPEEARPVREAEQRASAALVGVDTVEFLGLPDGILEYGVPLRRELTHVVRRHRPEIVITINFRDSWGDSTSSTRPTTSPPAGPCSTPPATPATGGSSPRPASDGTAYGRSGRPVPRLPGTVST